MDGLMGIMETASFGVIHSSVQVVAGLTIGSALDFLFQTYVYPSSGVPTSWVEAIELATELTAQTILLCMVSAVALTFASNSTAPDPACGLAFLLSSEYASAGLQSAMSNFCTYLKQEMGGKSLADSRSLKLENNQIGVQNRAQTLDSHNRSALRNLQTVAIYQ